MSKALSPAETAELRAQLASSQALVAAQQALLAERDAALAQSQQQLAARSAELAARTAELAANAALLRNTLRVHARHPTLFNVLGVVAARGYQREAAPLHGLCKATWRGDVLLIGALRNSPHSEKLATRLHSASERGWIARNSQLIVEDEANVEAVSRGGQTPLHWAAAAGQLRAALKLVLRGATVEAKDKKGHTPLIRACCNGHTEVARFLLDQGAAIEVKSDEGCTPLYCASHEGHTEVVKLLIARGAVVSAPTLSGETPLYAACLMSRAPAARELLAHGACHNVRASGGWLPLHRAAENDLVDALRELLCRPDTDVNARSDDGLTLLMLACYAGRLRTSTLLVGHEAARPCSMRGPARPGTPEPLSHCLRATAPLD